MYTEKVVLNIIYTFMIKAYVMETYIWPTVALCRYLGGGGEGGDPAPDYAQVYFPAQPARYVYISFYVLSKSTVSLR
jgi:hypothetical protein